MKTLADLKRSLVIGRRLKLKYRFGKELDDLREVEKVQSNSVKFIGLNGTKAGWLEFPKASLISFDGKTLKIYRAGLRPLNEIEQKARDNEPKDEEAQKMDLMTDTNIMFYRRKKYYKEIGLEYMFSSGKIQGKHLTYKDGKPMIQDDSIKGELDLVYEFEEVI